jgi:hypothetical protein
MQASKVQFGTPMAAYSGVQQRRVPVQNQPVQFEGNQGQGSQAAKRAGSSNLIEWCLIGGALCAVGCVGIPIAGIFLARHFLKKIPLLGKLIP